MAVQRRNYRRHLPHQIPENRPLFVTWNLKGSFLASAREALLRRRAELEKQPPRPGETMTARRLREQKILYEVTDRLLEQDGKGPRFLSEPPCAEEVERVLFAGSTTRYLLYAYVVMPNHVHALLKPIDSYDEIMKQIKGVSARRINLARGTTGRSMWQAESFDHWVRDADELRRIIEYIEQNPVVCGLAESREKWRWSSAHWRKSCHWPIGEPLREHDKA